MKFVFEDSRTELFRSVQLNVRNVLEMAGHFMLQLWQRDCIVVLEVSQGKHIELVELYSGDGLDKGGTLERDCLDIVQVTLGTELLESVVKLRRWS